MGILELLLLLIRPLLLVSYSRVYHYTVRLLTLVFEIAAAAARINAQLQARKGIQHVDVPPIQSADGGPPVRPPPPSGSGDANDKPPIHGEMYVSGGDFIQDIEINDLKNRYMVAKASTLQMIMRESGAGKFGPAQQLVSTRSLRYF